MSVAIVILNFNGRGFLEKFLPDVLLNTLEGKIYVADNGSTDDSVQLVEENFHRLQLSNGPTTWAMQVDIILPSNKLKPSILYS